MTQTRNGILFVCESVGSLNIARRVVKHFDFKCPIYVFTLDSLLIERKQELEPFNYITTDPHTVPGMLAHIKLVFLGAHESTPHCRTSNAIGFIAKKTGTALASIQHGWIQPGHNFTSSIKRIAYRGISTDNSRSLFHFSQILSFFGDDGIGYPYPADEPATAIKNNKNIIIATNFNWGIYDQSQVDTFTNSVKSLRNRFPDWTIVHRPHPAEKQETIENTWAAIYQEYNIGSTRENSESQELSWPSLVVSTPSSIALDYITIKTPTVLYSTDLLRPFMQELSLESNTFCEPDEFIGAINRAGANTEKAIPKFPSKAFISTIHRLFETNKPFNLSEENFLKFGAFLKT